MNAMSPDRWNRIREIFNEALERPSQERNAFLAEACAGEPELQQEIESLLKSGQTEFMERPAVSVAAESAARAESQALIGQRLNHSEPFSRTSVWAAPTCVLTPYDEGVNEGYKNRHAKHEQGNLKSLVHKTSIKNYVHYNQTPQP